MRLRCVVFLAAFLGLGSALGACPSTGSSRLLESDSVLAERALASSASSDPACRLLGRAVADFLDLPGIGACTAERVLEAGDGSELLAFRAALAWRCGRPIRAQSLARAALDRERKLTLAWIVLGQVLEARFQTEAARSAYDRALAISPRSHRALIGAARMADSRSARIEFLERYIDAGSARGERHERLRGARDNLALSLALGDRELWVLDRIELPSEIKLRPISAGVGDLRGYAVHLDIGGRRPVPALLDSGASGLHLAPRSARRVPIEPLAEGTLVGGGGKGEHAVRRGLLEALDLGPLAYRQALGVVAERSLHPRGAYRAILGLDLFGGLRLVFDGGRKRLFLDRADGESPESDPLRAWPWPRERGLVPLLRVEGQLLVPVVLEGEEVLALLDTGASRTLVDRSLAEGWPGYRATGRRLGRGYGGQMRFSGEVHVVEISIGTVVEEVRRVPVIDLSGRGSLTGVRIGAFLGLDVLSRTPFEVDLERGTVRLEP